MAALRLSGEEKNSNAAALNIERTPKIARGLPMTLPKNMKQTPKSVSIASIRL